MKNKLSVVIFIILALIFLLPQPSLGIEFEKCNDCHGKIKPIPPAILTKDCMACHGRHGTDKPDISTPENVHGQHVNNGKKSDKKECTICHPDRSAIGCVRCHSPHENTGLIKIQASVIDMSNVSACVNCHGQLPQPGGHKDFRGAISKSKHAWMNCRTCHINIYNAKNYSNYKFELHFGDLSIIPIDDSIDLCKICHSPQYKGLKESTHGEVGKACIDCHNPHTTKLGPMVKVTPKETPVNTSARIESAGNWITEKVPILKNTTVVIIILLIIILTIAEYILSKDEEGRKTTYNTIKIHGGEDKLKTLEVKLKNQNIDIINDILVRNDMDILGMTMLKEDDKDINIYRYIIFVNIEKLIDEKSLIDQIIVTDNVKSAIFTDKYEL